MGSQGSRIGFGVYYVVSLRFCFLTYSFKICIFSAIKWPNMHDLSICNEVGGDPQFSERVGSRVVGSDLVSNMWSV